MAARPSLRGGREAVQTTRESGSPTSLVLYRTTVSQDGPGNGLQHCPKKPLDVVAVERPDLRFPASCDAWWCEVCGPRKAQTLAALMTWGLRRAERRRLVTLTGLPDDFQRARWQVRDFARRVRGDGYAWEWCWAIEANPKGTGFHAHGVQHGDYVPQRRLQEAWGDRIVDVRALAKPGAGVYAVKEALRVAGYVTKGTGSNLSAHLERNGGRGAHWSRGFLHGRTRNEALAELRRELADGERLTWVTVPPGAEVPARHSDTRTGVITERIAG